MRLYAKDLVLTIAVALSSCSRSNNLFFGEVQAQVGKHTVRVTDCYRTSVPPPEQLPDVNGEPAYRFMPCRDADVRIVGTELTINGERYGHIGEMDSIVVDHGKVSVNAAEIESRIALPALPDAA